MRNFDEIHAAALNRKGVEMERTLPQPKTGAQLKVISDDRYLAAMTRSVFQSGFVWRVVDNKWPGFEEVFQGFDPELLSALPEAAYAGFSQDARIIRNNQKIRTVRLNAQFVVDIAAEYGSFGAMLADWPVDNIVGLWELLGKRGARLGGNTSGFFLRAMGKDTFLMTQDVTTILRQEGVIGKNPHTKSSRKAAQALFNTWAEQSGRPLSQISRLLSYTVSSEAPGLSSN